MDRKNGTSVNLMLQDLRSSRPTRDPIRLEWTVIQKDIRIIGYIIHHAINV
jgi:hypothetical protein